MIKPILIIGAGGFGREVYWLIREINENRREWNVLGFLDDDKSALDGFENYPEILGTLEDYSEINKRHNRSLWLINAIGDPEIKKRTVSAVSTDHPKWATLIHPTASVGTNSTLCEGCILARNSMVTCDARLGCHVHVNIYASCDHDTVLGNYCTLSPHVDIQGAARVGEGVFFGGHAVVLPKAKVGDWARVGAASLVLRNVKPGITVFGVPAKPII